MSLLCSAVGVRVLLVALSRVEVGELCMMREYKVSITVKNVLGFT